MKNVKIEIWIILLKLQIVQENKLCISKKMFVKKQKMKNKKRSITAIIERL